MKSVQNWPRLLRRVGRWRRREVDEIFDETERLEPAGPRRLGCEHHPVSSLAQDVADPMQLLVGPYALSGMNMKVAMTTVLA